MIRGATMFSGIGAPEVAMPSVEWVWCAEIEPFPSAVLAHHHPHIVNLGDVTADDFLDRATAFGEIDLLVAGSPCQSFSVAGLRRSLADERGNLTLRLVEAVHAINPRFLVWENVPGVLSTKDNAFGCFLAGLVGADAPLVLPAKHPRWRDAPGSIDGMRPRFERWFSWPDAGVVTGPKRTAAWRVLDAQYCHLAQRRERVFLVAGRAGERPHPGAILLEPESLRRDSPPGRAQRADVTGTIGGGAQSRGWCDDLDRAGAFIPTGFGGNRYSGSIDIATACRAKGGTGHGDFDSETFITDVPVGFDLAQITSAANRSTRGPHVAGTLIADGKAAGSSTQKDVESGNIIVTHPLTAEGFDASDDGTGRGTPIIPSAIPSAFQESQSGCREYGTVGCLRADGPGHDPVGTRIRHGAAVRRLTPRECERLQGFPDDYTLIPVKRVSRTRLWSPKSHKYVDIGGGVWQLAADGPRYRAIGNSMAVTVLQWLYTRIAKAVAA